MARASFKFEVSKAGLNLLLLRRGILGSTPVPVNDWPAAAPPDAYLSVARVLSALDADDGSVSQAKEALHLTHDFVSDLGGSQALGLGLPPSVPFILDVRAQGRFTSPEFNVTYQ